MAEGTLNLEPPSVPSRQNLAHIFRNTFPALYDNAGVLGERLSWFLVNRM